MHLPGFESGAAKMQFRDTKLTINTVRFSIVAKLKLSLKWNQIKLREKY